MPADSTSGFPGVADFSKSGSLLLAVSGGRDSMCMAELFFRADADFAVAHCNFHLRGEESDGDAAFVRKWADSRGIRYFQADFDTAGYADEKGISIEMAARDLRYAWFASLCREHGFRATAVAHNANDNAETLILNLVRGTGGRGIRGMKRIGNIPGATDILLIRPLLDVSRKQIDEFVDANSISFREDRTNADTGYRRNLIRHEVLPVLEKINPSFLKTASKEMEFFSEENDIAEDYFRMAADRLGDKVISIEGLKEFRHWKYLLYRYAEPLNMSHQALEALQIAIGEGKNVAGLHFQGNGGEIVGSSKDLTVVRYCEDARPDETMVISEEGVFEFGGRRISLSFVDAPADFQRKQPKGTVAFDADKLPLPLKLRRWKDGDWMCPLGMKGRKKLSDLFVDNRYSIPQKNSEILIEKSEGGRVAALLPMGRIDDSVKIECGTRRIATVKLS